MSNFEVADPAVIKKRLFIQFEVVGIILLIVGVLSFIIAGIVVIDSGGFPQNFVEWCLLYMEACGVVAFWFYLYKTFCKGNTKDDKISSESS